MTQQVEYKKLDRIRLEVIYKALKYVAHKEAVEVDEKHEDMADALAYSPFDTDVSDIPFVLDELYDMLKEFEDIKEELASDEDDE